MLPIDCVVEDVKNFDSNNGTAICAGEVLEGDDTARQDRLHCIEAWRHPILLYICRLSIRKQNDHGESLDR